MPYRRRDLVAALTLLGGCAPTVIPAGPTIATPTVEPDALVMPDGARLPLATWRPEGPPRAVLLALHGFNDHARNFLHLAAPHFAWSGLVVYGYDQRGFGGAPNRGVWPGAETLAADAATAARLLRARHPGVPMLLVGESMGAAALILAATAGAPLPADALVLLSPAIWGGERLPRTMRWPLWLAAHTIPLMSMQAGVSSISPTDNVAAMRTWAADPLTLKASRIDAAAGLVALMDAAVAAMPLLPPGMPTLVQVGAQDAVVPVKVARDVLRRAAPAHIRIGYYAEGWHLLLRDNGRITVANDLLAFLDAPGAALPSGAEQAARDWLAAG